VKQVHDIYDRVAKKLISMSKPQTIRLINGLYGKCHSLGSEVEFHWTEHMNDELKRTLADTIITIIDKETNERESYHLEIQMYEDKEIILRVFEYGYRHALTVRKDMRILRFPNPQILYLYEEGNAPDIEELVIDFGEQGQFTYRVPAFKYLKMSQEELEQRQLILLIPFQLLRLRKTIEKKRTPENMEALKELITHDILKAIQKNIAVGNLSITEGSFLKRLVSQLYQHIYGEYEELEKAGVNEMVEEALILDIDIIEYEHKKELERVRKETELMLNEKHQKNMENMVEKLRGMGVPEDVLAKATEEIEE